MNKPTLREACELCEAVLAEHEQYDDDNEDGDNPSRESEAAQAARAALAATHPAQLSGLGQWVVETAEKCSGEEDFGLAILANLDKFRDAIDEGN